MLKLWVFIDLKHPSLILPRKLNARLFAWEIPLPRWLFSQKHQEPKFVQEYELSGFEREEEIDV